MKILKKFDSYIKENLEEEEGLEEVGSGGSGEEGGLDTGEKNMPNKVVDATEEEDSYIGTKMLNDLARKLGTEVVDGSINYEGNKINFFSETEKFHIGKKKFATVEEVLAFLEKENPKIDKEEVDMTKRSMEEGGENFDDGFDDDIKESIITKRFRDFK
jgi:hypothetical protein